MAETLRFGIYSDQVSVRGRTVADVRRQYEGLWGMPRGVIAYRGGGRLLREGYVIQAGEVIEFHVVAEPEETAPPTAREMAEARERLLRAERLLQ